MPPANSPSETPALSPSGASPYLQQLEGISSPVPNYAATLVGHSEADDANDENVSFLRTRLRSSPDSSVSRQRRRRYQTLAFSVEDEQDQMELDDPRNLRMTVEINRRIPIVRRQREESNQVPNYEGRTSNVRSLYGWAPGSEDDEDDRRYESSQDSSGVWFGRGSERESGRTGITLRNQRREALGRIPPTFAGEPLEGGGYRYGESSISTEALLQSVRRQSRFSRSRTLQNYILDRERSGQDSDDRDRATASSTSRAYRFIPSTRAESYRNLTHADIRARINAHRHLYADNPPNTRIQETIKYLERVRFSNSHEESLSSAAESGFIQFDYFTNNEDDFILDTASIAPPAECSWLQPGMVFTGSQRAANSGSSQMLAHRMPSPHQSHDPVIVNGSDTNRISVYTSSGRRYWANNLYNLSSNSKDEHWPVKVTIHSVDYSTMTLSGTMEAYNIPDKTSQTQDAHIVTFLEGEIIDFNTHTLETKSFKADAEIDSTYWRELQPFKNLTDDEMIKSLVSKKWLTEELTRGWILMRWKERCFITPTDSRQGLTISGFYYISLRRDNGHIEGLYYDPGSSPYQQLRLKPEMEKMVFPAYGFR
ncbi:hypothetical protein VTN00DRAFT_2198 [Thermoascus crustaceus]|uniref:uncharacterized protein n=1 Tax=Thermoascus crustaceus TaxID=5088 RepID=UPI0037440F10